MSDGKFFDFTFTAPVLMAHPHLDEPQAVVKGGKLKYSAAFIVPQAHPDFGRLKETVMAAGAAQWPGVDLAALVKNWPWRNGSVEADKRKAKMIAAGKEYDGSGEFQRGHLILVGRSENPPLLAGFDAQGKMVEYPEHLRKSTAASTFFFGAEVYASVSIVAGGGTDGISPYITAYLNHVLATGGGKRIGGGRSAATTVFKGYVGHVSAVDPATGAAPAANSGMGIPF